MITPTPYKAKAALYLGTIRSTYGTGAGPREVRWSKDSRFVWVINYTAGTLTKVDAYTGVTVATHVVAAEATSFCISPDELFAFVCCRTVNRVYKIDLTTNASSFIATGVDPRGIDINPAGTEVYVACLSSDYVDVIDPATFLRITTIATHSGPIAVAFNHRGSKASVCCFTNSDLTIIDVATRVPTNTLTIGINPHFCCWSPDDRMVYVSCAGMLGTAEYGTYNMSTNYTWHQAIGTEDLSIDISPDGSLISIGDTAGEKLWRATLANPVNEYIYPNGSIAMALVWGVRFSPNGRYLAAANVTLNQLNIIRVQTN